MYSACNWSCLHIFTYIFFIFNYVIDSHNGRYKRRSIKELHKMLHRCNEQLQQFSHVNKKALDQYVNFTEQREELQKRQAELDAGDEVYIFSGISITWTLEFEGKIHFWSSNCSNVVIQYLTLFQFNSSVQVHLN